MTFATLLFVVFLVLKLCGVIAWSWLWVTAPIWIGAIVAVLCLAGYAALIQYCTRGWR